MLGLDGESTQANIAGLLQWIGENNSVPREGLESALSYGRRILSHPDRGKVRNTTECPSPIF